MLKRLVRFVPTVLLIMVLLTVLMNLVMLMMGWLGYWTNITDSMPVGVYKETEEKITRGNFLLNRQPLLRSQFKWLSQI